MTNPFDEHWRHSLAYPLAGVGASSMVGWLTGPQAATIATALALAITGIGGAVVGLIRQWQLSRVKLEMRLVELEMMRRKLDELPAADLKPEEIAREVDAPPAPPPAP